MGMVVDLKRVSPSRLAELRDGAPFDEDELDGDDYFDAVTNPVGIFCSLDKAWHGVHWIMNGAAWSGTSPLDFLVNGDDVNDEDQGYGPARGLDADQVRLLSTAMNALSDDALRARLVAEDLEAAEIYPTIWDRADEWDDNKAWLLHEFNGLRAFVGVASEAGEALLVWCS